MDNYEKLFQILLRNYREEDLQSFITLREYYDNSLSLKTEDLKYVGNLLAECLKKVFISIEGVSCPTDRLDGKLIFRYQ